MHRRRHAAGSIIVDIMILSESKVPQYPANQTDERTMMMVVYASSQMWCATTQLHQLASAAVVRFRDPGVIITSLDQFFFVFLMLFDFVLSILFGGSMWSESMPSEEPLLNGGSWVSDKRIINDSLCIHWTICLRDYQVWNGSDWYKYCDFLKRSSGR